MRAVFIGGSGRSGTTLLGDLLGAHPRHVCTPETSYKLHLVKSGWGGPDGNLAEGLSEVRAHPKFRDLGIELSTPSTASLSGLFADLVSRYGNRVGKPDADVWIDHTPSNLAIGGTLLDQFPDSTFIHIVRDGRAVAASIIRLDWGPNNVFVAARNWVRSIAVGLALETAYPQRVRRVSYEDLVSSPGNILEQICRFAGLEYRDAMTKGGGLVLPKRTYRQHSLVGRAPDPSRIGHWKRVLSPREVETYESQTSDLLALLGYVPVYGARAGNPSRMASLAYEVHHLARAITINRLKLRRRYRE